METNNQQSKVPRIFNALNMFLSFADSCAELESNDKSGYRQQQWEVFLLYKKLVKNSRLFFYVTFFDIHYKIGKKQKH